jgi:polyhydroxyalkanoate depolymerase
MFYHWLESQRALMRSLDAWAALASAPWGAALRRGADDREAAPYRGDGGLASVALPGCDWIYRLLQATPEPPPFGIASVRIAGRDVPVSEAVVDRTPFCALRRFTREFDAPPPEPRPTPHRRAAAASRRRARHAASPTDDERAQGPACILLVTPLAGHHAVMLRETVETLLEDADVYVTDWSDARDVPLAQGRFGLSDYVLIVERFVRALAERGVHVLAVCQAAPPALAASALAAASDGRLAPLSMALMGGPIDTRLHPTMIDRLAATHDIEWFRRSLIDVVPSCYAGAGRRIYPGYVQHATIVAAHPHRQMVLESRHWTSRMSGDTSAIAASLRALNEYSAVLDMDEDYFLDTLRIVFQEQRLARGTWCIGARKVAPNVLTDTALCTVEGDRDDITGAEQTHAAHLVCVGIPDSMRVRMTVSDCDHYDLFTGPRWRDAVHPALREFWATNEATSEHVRK